MAAMMDICPGADPNSPSDRTAHRAGWVGTFSENVRALAAKVEAATGNPITTVRKPEIASRGAAAQLATYLVDDGTLRLEIEYQSELTPTLAIHELLHAQRIHIERVPVVVQNMRLAINGADLVGGFGSLELDTIVEHFTIYRQQANLGYPRDFSDHVALFRHLGAFKSRFVQRIMALSCWVYISMFSRDLIPLASSELINHNLWDDAQRYEKLVRANLNNKLRLVEITAAAIGFPQEDLRLYVPRFENGQWQVNYVSIGGIQ
jgi:hypothetical protein